MSIKVLVNGAFGRMGQITTKALNEDKRFELVGQTGKEYDLKKAIIDSQADVVVDFTHPDDVLQNTNIIIEANARPVIGTTGLKAADIKHLETLCAQKKLGGVIAPNFSLGAILMMKYAQEIVKYMPEVEIVECHHQLKAESPSGTAIHTAEMLATARNREVKSIESKEIITGARGAKHHGIAIHAVRLPGFLAHQKIIFGNSGETLTLSHDSIDRASFMPGVLLACEKVMTLDKLIYGLALLIT